MIALQHDTTPESFSSLAAGASRRSLLRGFGGSAVAITGLMASRTAYAQEATPAPDAVTVTNAVAYAQAGDRQLLLDVYQPRPANTPQPAVIVIHPGGFFDGERIWMEEFARGLASAGYVAFAIDHRMADAAGTEVFWPKPLIDAQQAVRWVRANAATYQVDPERLAAFGYSSGALLALQLGMRDTLDNRVPELATYSSRVTCVVDIAAHTDTAVPWPNPDDTAGDITILGGTPADVPEAYRDYAVLSHVTKDAAPTLILHSPDDTWTPITNSRHLAAALDDAGVEVVFYELAGIEHIDWNWATAGPWTLAFLARQFDAAR